MSSMELVRLFWVISIVMEPSLNLWTVVKIDIIVVILKMLVSVAARKVCIAIRGSACRENL